MIVRRVRRAIETTLTPTSWLRTPDRSKGKDFRIDSIGKEGITVNKLPHVSITWEELGNIVSWLMHRGNTRGEQGYTCNVGSIQGSKVVPDTLEWRLREFTGSATMKSSYVAPILEAGGIVLVDGRRPNSITLAAEWR